MFSLNKTLITITILFIISNQITQCGTITLIQNNYKGSVAIIPGKFVSLDKKIENQLADIKSNSTITTSLPFGPMKDASHVCQSYDIITSTGGISYSILACGNDYYVEHTTKFFYDKNNQVIENENFNKSFKQTVKNQNAIELIINEYGRPELK